MADNSKTFLLVSEFFHPDTASTARYMTDLATGLDKRGVSIEVLTSNPHYHSGDFDDETSKAEQEGVPVKRVPGSVVRNKSVYHRLLNWFVFGMMIAYALLRTYDSDEYELLFVTSPPILPPVVYILSRVTGHEYHYILYDYYPDAAAEIGYISKDGVVYGSWRWLHERILDNAKNIFVSGENMIDKITTNSAVQSEDVHLIHHWEEEDFITPVQKDQNWFSEEHGFNETFTILYSGNIGEHHDLETLIRASPQLPDGVRVVIIGEGDKKEALIALAEKLDVRGETVQFLPFQDWNDLPYTLTSGDVSVVTVREGFKGLCVSCKVYTALATGQPILVISEDGDDEARIVEKHDAGMQVEQGDVEGVRSVIEQWYEDEDLVQKQSKNAREAFERNYTKRMSLDQYYAILGETETGKHSPEKATSAVQS